MKSSLKSTVQRKLPTKIKAMRIYIFPSLSIEDIVVNIKFPFIFFVEKMILKISILIVKSQFQHNL